MGAVILLKDAEREREAWQSYIWNKAGQLALNVPQTKASTQKDPHRKSHASLPPSGRGYPDSACALTRD